MTEHQPQLRFFRSLCGKVHTTGPKLKVVDAIQCLLKCRATGRLSTSNIFSTLEVNLNSSGANSLTFPGEQLVKLISTTARIRSDRMRLKLQTPYRTTIEAVLLGVFRSVRTFYKTYQTAHTPVVLQFLESIFVPLAANLQVPRLLPNTNSHLRPSQ